MLALAAIFAVLLAATSARAADPERPPLDCGEDPCALVLPGAVRFEPASGRPYAVGFDADGDRVGWVVLSTDVVDVKGYSGKPIATLVGLDEQGIITGGKVVHHSEPILLVGIPESELDGFVAAYAGLHATEKVVVGGVEPGARTVDVVSGATVTVLAENLTILDSARALAEDVGVIAPQVAVPGHFVADAAPWTWDRLVKRRVMGRLVVAQEEMGAPPSDAPYLDLWFTIADAPHVGVPLLGKGLYDHATARLEAGEHLVVMLNTGTGSFKGSGFVRGGIFDRVRIEQGLRTITFADLDYTNLGRVYAEGAPEIREGAMFVARGGLDPGAPYTVAFLGSRFTLAGGIDRDFHTFKAQHRLPRSVYVLDGLEPELQMALSAWKARPLTIAFVVAYLALAAGVFVARRWVTASQDRLKRIHTGFLVASFVVLGLWLHLQPSVTQLLTLLGGVVGEWRWSLFLSDPLLFVTWVFIALMIFAWGRGVFCGWVCPYGAMSELLFRVGRALRLPELELPDGVHLKARYTRYILLFGLVALFLWSPRHGEMAAEIEPFKSTFFVPFWTRGLALAGWWLVLAAWAMVTYRPFCRYLCPLGAAIALPSTFRVSSPKRRDFCSKCRICTKGCEPRAFRADGTIDPRECLNCWECEANWSDDQVCPPLVNVRRKAEKAARPAPTGGAR